VRWREVAALRLIGAPREYPIQIQVDEQLAIAGRHAPTELVCNYLETQIAMVEAGAGAAVVPTSAAAACAKRRIRMHAVFDPIVRTDFYWVVNRSRTMPASAEDFSLYLKECLEQIAEHWTLPGERDTEGGSQLEPDRVIG
jgi:DNA-binding transcriptional LysR family regulator